MAGERWDTAERFAHLSIHPGSVLGSWVRSKILPRPHILQAVKETEREQQESRLGEGGISERTWAWKTFLGPCGQMGTTPR